MPKISIVINVDSRPQNDKAEHSFQGTVSEDFLLDGVLNKIKFFSGFDTEVVLHIDKHNDIPCDLVVKLQEIVDVLIIRKHTSEPSFNDHNYIRALQCCTGDIICHWDQDSMGFSSSSESVQEMISLLETHTFISYPSPWSPLPVYDESFDHVWCSTRFFMCKRESLDIPELIKCLDYNYWCLTYPVNRKCHWTEHLIGSIAKYRNQSVYYPKIDHDKIIIFSWGSYRQGVINQLNNMEFIGVNNWLCDHPVYYPNDCFV